MSEQKNTDASSMLVLRLRAGKTELTILPLNERSLIYGKNRTADVEKLKRDAINIIAEHLDNPKARADFHGHGMRVFIIR